MKTLFKNEVSKFILMVVAGSTICLMLASILTKIIATNTNDIMFVVGLFLTIGAVFSMIEGRSVGVESVAHPESKIISNESLDVTKLDKEKLLTSVYIIDKVQSTLLTTEFLTIGLITLIISYIF